jgi:hypothetical protein
MHSALQFFLDSSQPGPHPIAARLPLELKDALPGSATDVGNPRKLNVSGLARPRRVLLSAA